jgi:ABC-type multidrug transport system fused ATPase/permease subunit
VALIGAVLIPTLEARRVRSSSRHCGSLTMAGQSIRAVSTKGENAAVLSDQMQRSITGMRIIKAFGMEAHEERGFVQNSLICSATI